MYISGCASVPYKWIQVEKAAADFERFRKSPENLKEAGQCGRELLLEPPKCWDYGHHLTGLACIMAAPCYSAFISTIPCWLYNGPYWIFFYSCYCAVFDIKHVCSSPQGSEYRLWLLIISQTFIVILYQFVSWLYFIWGHGNNANSLLHFIDPLYGRLLWRQCVDAVMQESHCFLMKLSLCSEEEKEKKSVEW